MYHTPSSLALARTIANATAAYNLAVMIGPPDSRSEKSLRALVRAHRILYAAQRRPPYEKNFYHVQNSTDAAASQALP